MKDVKLSRRHLLAALGAGGMAMALPMLPSLIPRAHAAPLKPPKRFIAIAHYVGHHIPDFFPTAQADMRVDDNTFYKKLVDIPGNLSTVFDAKFDPYRSKMNIFQGLDSTGGGGHNITVPLCASTPVSDTDDSPKYGRSIDVLMAKSPRVYDATPRFDAVRMGNDYYGGSTMSFDRDASGKAVKLPGLTGDTNIFNVLFDPANLNPGAQAAAARHKLLVDRSYDRYQALAGNPRLSQSDRARFEAHVAGMTDLQKRLSSTAACARPGLVPYTPAMPRELLWHNQIDALVGAMSCDMTRVASMYIFDYKFGTDTQNYSESHGNSHDREGNPTSSAQAAGFSRFKADQVLYLLKRLSSTTEVDGSSMLDNTVLLWTSELSNGNYHTNSDLPIATFGGASGALKTGYLMDFRLKPIQFIAGRSDFLTPLGQAYNRLLVTIMRAMGMQDSEFVNEGDGGGFGEFRKNGEYLTNQYTQFIGQRNTSLPIVTA